MRIKEESLSTQGANGKGHASRANRASDHAAARQKARHAERDYFGRIIEEPDPHRGLSEGAIMRSQMGAVRLDAWLVNHGFAPSRDKAKDLISSGRVFVDGTTQRVKPSMPIMDDMSVDIRSTDESIHE